MGVCVRGFPAKEGVVWFLGVLGMRDLVAPHTPRPVPLGCPHCVPSAKAPAATLLKMKHCRGRGEERLVGWGRGKTLTILQAPSPMGKAMPEL